MRFIYCIFTFLIYGTSAAEVVECEIEQVSRLSEDKLSLLSETGYDRFEGAIFGIDLLSGSISNLGDLDDHTWRNETYQPNPERDVYTMRLVSITLPMTYAILNVVKSDGRVPEDFFFYIIVRDGHGYSGTCQSSPNN